MKLPLLFCCTAYTAFMACSAAFADMHKEYETYAETIVTAGYNLSRAMEQVYSANENVVDANSIKFTREMQALLVAKAKDLYTSMDNALNFSKKIQKQAIDPEKCAAGVTEFMPRLKEFSRHIATFAALDPEGGDKAEAYAAATGFLAYALEVAKITIDPLTTCSIQR